MDDLLFYLAFGGATLILIYGGIQIRRKYPRIHRETQSTIPLEEVRRRLWEETERERIGKRNETQVAKEDTSTNQRRRTFN